MIVHKQTSYYKSCQAINPASLGMIELEKYKMFFFKGSTRFKPESYYNHNFNFIKKNINVKIYNHLIKY